MSIAWPEGPSQPLRLLEGRRDRNSQTSLLSVSQICPRPVSKGAGERWLEGGVRRAPTAAVGVLRQPGPQTMGAKSGHDDSVKL